MSRYKIYKPEQYIGELNLLALERRIIIRELKKTQSREETAKLIRCSLRGLADKIHQHQILLKEWITEGKKRSEYKQREVKK